MSGENVSKDIEESARNVKNGDKAAEVIKEMEKDEKVINVVSNGLPTSKATYLKIIKVNDKVMNMVKRNQRLLHYLRIFD